MITLFCLPHAGASSSIYLSWRRRLSDNIELFPIELKGRGVRYYEAFYDNLWEAVEDVYQMIKPELIKPYAFFGHSMGGLIVYELYRKIKIQNNSLPEHIFFSGSKLPHLSNNYMDNAHLLPDEDFMKYLLQFDGIPEELFAHQELVDYFLPILRADYKIIEELSFPGIVEPFDCPITIFNGKEDMSIINNHQDWSMYTKNNYRSYLFEGGHFYLYTKSNDLIQIINQTLTNPCPGVVHTSIADPTP
jgi:medium-chain acyl-[acyl-carrier-protein] hydrolase